jgi:ABC-type Fe3+-hydroxamate transport system substrate-binding protein
MKTIRFFLLFVVLWTAQNHMYAQPYNRVVSLAPSLTKNIYYLNARQQLVGCTNYCTIAKNDNKTVVASPVTVNIEKVVSLNPDLVIATSITNPEYIGLLKKFNIHVEVFPSPQSFDEICSQFIAIGRLLGKKDEAIKKVNLIQNEIDSIKKQTKDNSHKKIFFQIGAKPLFTVIPNTFMNDYIVFANAVNIASDLTKGTISRESVIFRKPDYIFIVTMGMVGEEEKKIWETYKGLSAVQDNHIYIIDSDLACTPTPQTFLETMKTVIDYINN